MFLASAIEYVFDIRFSEIQDASSTLGSLKWPKLVPPRSSDRHSPRLGIVAAQSAGIDEPPTPDQTPNIEFWDFVKKTFCGFYRNFNINIVYIYVCSNGQIYIWMPSLLMEEISKLLGPLPPSGRRT